MFRRKYVQVNFDVPLMHHVKTCKLVKWRHDKLSAACCRVTQQDQNQSTNHQNQSTNQ